ncbi:MAG: beta-N-acetylhexosaminidase [Puniceicoccales bacterium]|nr:beta-N-acetylhexosaminidase [Puniceicoccales bacterium]
MSRVTRILFLVFFSFVSGLSARDGVIPRPLRMESAGRALILLDGMASIVCADPELARTAGAVIHKHTGLYLDAGKRPAEGSRLVIYIDPANTSVEAKALGPEGYLLDIAGGRGAKVPAVIIRSIGRAGAFYGLQTLMHLLRVGKGGEIHLSPTRVVDKPRFAWRGLFLNGELCFLDKKSIKHLLDLMAFYKLNVLHWRLAGDEMWRLEVKRYPGLTPVGRECYYTQADVREIVAYAAARQIRVVPALSLPIHDYTLDGKVSPAAAMPKNNERTVSAILEELCALFPSPYLHVETIFSLRDDLGRFPMDGNSAVSRNRLFINDLKMKASAVVKNILLEKNRRNMTWEDRNYLLAYSMDAKASDAENAADVGVVRYQDVAFLKRRLSRGVPVVVAPDFYLRFDYMAEKKPTRHSGARQDFSFLKYVYEFPGALGVSSGTMLGGYEALCFPEKNFSLAKVESMLFPRVLVLAELCWTSGELCVWENFRRRLPEAVRRLEFLQVNYCKDNLSTPSQTE